VVPHSTDTFIRLWHLLVIINMTVQQFMTSEELHRKLYESWVINLYS